MSGSGGGIIIIGDQDLITEIQENMSNVAKFRQSRAKAIIAAYKANENSITRDEQQFLLRCASDIVDN